MSNEAFHGAESFGALLKLSGFIAVTGGCTFLLMLILGNGSFAARNEYKAVFTDVTGVAKGDDVRVAGVAVGSISKVEIVNRDKALVTFGVDADTPLTQNTNVTIKFRNLVGQRYLALTQGSEGAKTLLKPGSHHRRGEHPGGTRPQRAAQRVQAGVPGAGTR